VSYKQLLETFEQTKSKLEGENNQVISLNSELADATAQISTLQFTIQRLRSSDIEELATTKIL
jgi:uncharacterized phage infection (PIP) family protein YhgE